MTLHPNPNANAVRSRASSSLALAGMATSLLLFCLAWVLPAWLLFELIPTKLPHYLLPVYPALALLAARAWLAAARFGPLRYRRWMHRLWLALGILPPPLILAAYAYWHPDAAADPLSIVALLIAGIALAGILAFGMASHSRRKLGLMFGGILLFYALSFQWLLPAMQPLWLSRTVADGLERFRPAGCSRVRLLSVGYQEPSLVFLAGTDTRLLDGQAPQALQRVRDFLQQGPCRAALLPGNLAQGLLLDPVFHTLERIQGINYSKGRRLDLQLLYAAPPGVHPGAKAARMIRELQIIA